MTTNTMHCTIVRCRPAFILHRMVSLTICRRLSWLPPMMMMMMMMVLPCCRCAPTNQQANKPSRDQTTLIYLIAYPGAVQIAWPIVINDEPIGASRMGGSGGLVGGFCGEAWISWTPTKMTAQRCQVWAFHQCRVALGCGMFFGISCNASPCTASAPPLYLIFLVLSRRLLFLCDLKKSIGIPGFNSFWTVSRTLMNSASATWCWG